MSTLSCGHSSLFIDIGYVNFFCKILKIRLSDSGIGLSAHLSSPLIFSYIRTYVLSFPYTILGFLHLIVNMVSEP